MSGRSRRWIVAGLLATCLLVSGLAPGCRGGRLPVRPAALAAHVADARDAAAPPAPGAPEEAAARAEAIEAFVTAWEEKLERPRTLGLVRDFDTERMRALRAAARGPSPAAPFVQGFTTEHVVATVFERSPAIRAARLKLRATLNQYAQVTWLDAIVAQYASFQRGARLHAGMPPGVDSLDKSFPFPGVVELKAALVGHAVEEARARHAATVRDVVVEAQVLLARLAWLDGALDVQRSMLSLLGQLEDAARAKFEAGAGPKSHLLQAQVEISDLRNGIVTLEDEREVVRADLLRALDLPADTALGTWEAETPPALGQGVEALRALALEHQPDLQVVRARLQRMQTMIELAERQAFPPIASTMSLPDGPSQAAGGGDGKKPSFSTEPASRPDPWFGSKEAYLREARDAARAAEARLEAVRNRTVYAVKQAHTDLRTASRLLALHRDVQLAQARQAYRDASSAYAADEAGFLQVLDAARLWLRFRLGARSAERDLRVAHARLEGAVGRTLLQGSK